MSLDISKLTNVKKHADGKITSRCPACQAAGGDAKGEHLVTYADGKYGCAANPQDSGHNKEIFQLVGVKANACGADKITVKSVKIPESSVIMDLGRFGRFSKPRTIIPMPQQTHQPAPAEPDLDEEQAFIKSEAPQPVSAPTEEVSEADPVVNHVTTEEEAMDFLNQKVG